MHVPAPHGGALIALVAALAGAAVSDALGRRVPNHLTGPLALAGILHACTVGGLRAGSASVLGGGVGVLLLYVQFRKGLMGGGDVKLLGAIGTWSGWLGSLYVLLAASLLGGLLALVELARLDRRGRGEVAAGLAGAARAGELKVASPPTLLRARGIPYGIALALAGAGVIGLGVGQ
jgi:prepilin peptidase CpaA